MTPKKRAGKPANKAKQTNYQSTNERIFKMKKFRILMGALALAVVAATVIACSKEKETKVAQQTTENNERKPIATYDNATGQMTYHVSVEHLQAAMDKYTTSKSVGDVIVESWSITDNGSTENPIMMLSVLEVDTESQHSNILSSDSPVGGTGFTSFPPAG